MPKYLEGFSQIYLSSYQECGKNSLLYVSSNTYAKDLSNEWVWYRSQTYFLESDWGVYNFGSLKAIIVDYISAF